MVSRIPPSRRTVWICGLGFILCCVGFANLRYKLESARQRDQLEWRNESRINAVSWRYSRCDLPELRTKLKADNVVFDERAEPDGIHVIVPASAIEPEFNKWTLNLQFGFGTGWQALKEIHVVPPPGLLDRPSQLWWSVEYGRVAIFGIGGVIWLAGMVLMICVRGIRKPVASICLAAAIACMLAAGLSIEIDWQVWRKPWQNVPWRQLDGGVAMALVAAGLWLIPARRAAPGLCATCNYDLTGNVSGVCPECGTETEAGLRKQRLAEVSPMAERLDHIELNGIASESEGETELSEDAEIGLADETPDTELFVAQASRL